MGLKLLTIAFASLIGLLVLDLVRREKLTFKYAFSWLVVSFSAIILAIFNEALFALAKWIGFELPSNFIFFTLISFLIFISLLMTVYLSQQNHRNETMAQKIGILESELNALKKKCDESKEVDL